ncbi:MAG: uroporphyrinogen-III synthase, partial [Pseudomonadales bacterium]|nr:uroporphyrinogen-III synthase [Pseudomonadales bacterium]
WPELQNLQEKRVLILRGQSGRETLANTLRERGAQVDYLELYKRALPDVDASGLITPLAAGQRLNITVTSGDGLRNLMALVVEQLSHLQNCPLVVVSGRLAQFAKEQGFRQVIEANSASGDDIVQALAGLESN